MGRDALYTHIKAIDKKLAGLTPFNAEEHCIFKVHEQLLKVNEKAYKPVLLAIGPYNDHGKVGQGLMEEHKLRYLKQMLKRRNESSVEAYISALTQLEEKARNCYAERIRLNELVEMMLLDGCFIIELFCKLAMLNPRDEHDPIFQMGWMFNVIARDLLLFENQLPFFVLNKLFLMIESSQTPRISPESSTSKDPSVQIRRSSLGDLALRFFSGSIPFRCNVNGSKYSIKDTKYKHPLFQPHKAFTPSLAQMVHKHLEVGYKLKNADFKHLLDLIHTVIKLSVLDMELHRATELQDVGVKFKKGEIFKHLFGLIRRVASPLLAKLENMKKGGKRKSSRHAIELQQKPGFESNMAENSKHPDDDLNNRIEDWNSIPYGIELHEAGVEFNMAEKFRDKFEENKRWKKLTPYDDIAFQEAGIELEKAEKFRELVSQERSNEDSKSKLCGAKFEMIEKLFMRLPFLNKIENWNSIPHGTKLKEAGVHEFKKAKKFWDTLNMLKNLKTIPSATELKEGGVKFKKGKKHNTFAIKFSNGILEISPLRIQDETETFMRNLIAYEQYSPNNDSKYVTNYICFIDELINSPKDVELLRRKEIIENLLGDDEVVSSMVNKLGHHVTISTRNSIYVKTSIDLNKHCAKHLNVWMAKLRHIHFNSPWALISVSAAIVLLGLAITQTVFSIIH